MTQAIRQLRNFIMSLAITYIAFFVLTLLPGIRYEPHLFAIWIIALVFTVLSAYVRAVLLALTLPLTIMSAGLFIFVIDGLLLLVTAWVTGLDIARFWWAIVAAFVMSIVNTWVEAAFRRLGWLELEDEEPTEFKTPGLILRVLLLLGLLFGFLFSLSMAVQFTLALSTISSNLVVIFSVGLVFLFSLSFGIAGLVAQGLKLHRRIIFSSVVSILATGTVVLLIVLVILPPLDSSIQPPQPGSEIQYWDLPTGSRIAYVHYPALGEARPAPIVYLHDGPGWAVLETDREFYSQFAEDGFDVYLYDQGGTGLSSRLRVVEYGISRNVADLDAIRKRIGADDMILIGLGAGGELAARYMSRYPERVAGVVLHSPTPTWDDRRFEYNFVLTGSPLGSVVSLEPRPFYAGLMALYGPKAAEKFVSQDEISGWYTRSLAPAALVCARHVEQAPQFQASFNYYAYVRTVRSADDPPDPRPRLVDNLTPVLLLASECDYIPWEVVLQYQEALYHLKVFYFEGAGHMINLTRPDEMAAVIRAFLLKEDYPMEPYTGSQNPRPVVPGIGL